MSKPENMTAQELYLYNHIHYHHFVTACRLLIFVSFLIIWEISAHFGWIDRFFFSSPIGVVQNIYTMLLHNNLLGHIFVTLAETLLSFAIVTCGSFLLATVLWHSEYVSKILDPYLVILNSLPKSALAPLFLVWFGTGFATVIICGIFVAFFSSTISLYTAFLQTDKDKSTLIYTLGGNKKDVFHKIVVPSSIPHLVSLSKVNIGLCLVGVIIGEFICSRYGLGHLIIYGSQVFKLDMVISSIVILCGIAFGLYKVVQSLEHREKKKNPSLP